MSATEYLDRLRERTEQLAPDDADFGDAHRHLTRAMALALERVAEIYDPDEGLPGAPLLDPETCPAWALPWLAQVLGVPLPPGLPEAEARVLVASVGGWARGTRGALLATAQALTTGTHTVFFEERNEDADDPPYSFLIRTLESETPDSAALERALRLQKPGGLIMDYGTVAGLTWDALGGEYATWDDLGAAFSTWDRVIANQPD